VRPEGLGNSQKCVFVIGSGTRDLPACIKVSLITISVKKSTPFHYVSSQFPRMKFSVLWDITPCITGDIGRRFLGTCRPYYLFLAGFFLGLLLFPEYGVNISPKPPLILNGLRNAVIQWITVPKITTVLTYPVSCPSLYCLLGFTFRCTCL
jgi:hypothetical protein